MRNIKFHLTLISSSLLFILNCNSQPQGYNIEVTVDKIDQSTAYLGYYYGDKRYVTDTSQVINNKAVFTGEEALPGGIYFFYTPSDYFEIIVDSDQHFNLTTDTLDYVKNMKVTGSKENELFRDLRLFVSQKQKKAAELNQKLQTEKDEQAAADIRKQLAEIENEVTGYQENIVEKHPNLFLANILKATRRPDIPEPEKDESGKPVDPNYQFNYYKAHFFDNIDLSDDRNLRTNFLHAKLMEYLEKLTHPHPDSVIKSASFIIDQARDNPDMFRYMVVTLTSKYETSEIMGMDKVFVELAEKYYLSGDADWADEDVIEKIRTKVEETKPNLIGKPAPPMVIYETDTTPVNLYDLQSKYLVLFFFDPDCSHCKKVAPKLYDIYAAIKIRGGEVIPISTQPAVAPLIDFNEELKIDWKTYLDFQYQRKDYSIFTTPVIYILDKNKKIIGKRLDVNQILDFLDNQNKNTIN